MVELIVLLLAGAVVLIIFRQLKHKESKEEILVPEQRSNHREKNFPYFSPPFPYIPPANKPLCNGS